MFALDDMFSACDGANASSTGLGLGCVAGAEGNVGGSVCRLLTGPCSLGITCICGCSLSNGTSGRDGASLVSRESEENLEDVDSGTLGNVISSFCGSFKVSELANAGFLDWHIDASPRSSACL